MSWPWDRENRYTEGHLKEYKHWVLGVHYRQPVLGCFIILAKREIERISELTDKELANLRVVMQEIEGTLTKIEAFKPDRFNYWQMGNSLHHLHIHGFPRYKTPREFDGKEWIDETWGTLPVWAKEDGPDELVVKIRDAIKPHLP